MKTNRKNPITNLIKQSVGLKTEPGSCCGKPESGTGCCGEPSQTGAGGCCGSDSGSEAGGCCGS